jgi:hypothetical protein
VLHNGVLKLHTCNVLTVLGGTVAVDIPATKTFRVGVSFNDSTPVGGTVDLIVDREENNGCSSIARLPR